MTAHGKAKWKNMAIGAMVTATIFILGIVYASGSSKMETKKEIQALDNRVKALEACMADIVEMRTDIRWIKTTLERRQ